MPWEVSTTGRPPALAGQTAKPPGTHQLTCTTSGLEGNALPPHGAPAGTDKLQEPPARRPGAEGLLVHGAGVGQGLLRVRAVAIAGDFHAADRFALGEPGRVWRHHPYLVPQRLLAPGQCEQESPRHVVGMAGEVVGDEEDLQRAACAVMPRRSAWLAR